MFTGIIEEVGTIQNVLHHAGGLTVTIEGSRVAEDIDVGHSIAVNGVCLTVTHIHGGRFTVQAVEETVEKTTLRRIQVRDRVNLERALRPSQRLGGHIVTGHVDGIGIVRSRVEKKSSLVYTIGVPQELTPYVVVKGSVAVDGVSLTVAQVRDSQFVISVIPYTARVTTLGLRKVGDGVNVEVDLIGKYVKRLLERKRGTVTEAWLKEMG